MESARTWVARCATSLVMVAVLAITIPSALLAANASAGTLAITHGAASPIHRVTRPVMPPTSVTALRTPVVVCRTCKTLPIVGPARATGKAVSSIHRVTRPVMPPTSALAVARFPITRPVVGPTRLPAQHAMRS